MSKKALQIQDMCVPFRVTGIVESKSGRSPALQLYNAVHEPSGENVTLTILSKEAAANERQRKRFQAETKIFEAIDHPNVLRLLGSGEVQGRPWRAMELASGGSLRGKLDSLVRPMLNALALCFARQIGDALGELHKAGVTHGELSPECILLSDFDEVKLRHLGVAPLILGGEVISAGDLRPEARRYAAPERLRGDLGDVRSDVFSAGVILRDLLEGPSTKDKPHWLPHVLRALVAKATAADPAERYSSMAAFSEAVNEAWNVLLEHQGEGAKEELERALTSLGTTLRRVRTDGEEDADSASAADLEALLLEIGKALRGESDDRRKDIPSR